jgi:hypothetical protein
MQISAREETELPENTNEQERQPEISDPTSTPEPEAGQPEPPEQEKTALVPTEPEVIEGEFVELEPKVCPEAYTSPKQKPYWLLIPFAMQLCLLFLAGSLLVPLFIPMATVTILPVERSITTTAAIQVQGRRLPALTLSQSQTILATGKRHQDATEAHGTITFYNGLFTSQTIAAGSVLTGNDGVQVVTDQRAIIPAANPPYIGQVTVRAHAQNEGMGGNIQAGDINQVCCVTGVKAVNTIPFTGGAAARDYLVVTTSDLTSAEAAIKPTLLKSERAAFDAQAITGENLTPPLCFKKVLADHRRGEEAKEVTVTVSDTCSSIAYAAYDVYQDATQIETLEAVKRLGTGYSLRGDTKVTIIHATITNQARGIATLAVTLDATYVYQLSPGEKQQLLRLVAGKPKQQAISLLLTQSGIQGVQITVKDGNQMLPQDPGGITIRIQYIAV